MNNFIYFIRDNDDNQIIDLFQIHHKKLFWFNQTIIEMKGDEIFNKYEYQDLVNVLKISKFTYEDGKMKVY